MCSNSNVTSYVFYILMNMTYMALKMLMLNYYVSHQELFFLSHKVLGHYKRDGYLMKCKYCISKLRLLSFTNTYKIAVCNSKLFSVYLCILLYITVNICTKRYGMEMLIIHIRMLAKSSVTLFSLSQPHCIPRCNVSSRFQNAGTAHSHTNVCDRQN